MLDNYSQKMEIARKFRGLHFDRQSMRCFSKTIKDYSQKYVRQHIHQQTTRKLTISSRRESQPCLSAAKQNRKTSLSSWMDTNCTISPIVDRENANTIRVNIFQLNPESFEESLHSLEQAHLESLRKSSQKYIPQKAMKNNRGMRAKLVDWLMQVSEELQLTKEVLYNSVFYVDKVSSVQSIPRSKYQLLGIAALSLASKLQFQYGIKPQTFLEAMDGCITKQDLTQMQQTILKAMKFRMNPPTLFHHLTAILKLLQTSKTKDYMVVNDLLAEDNFKQYRQLTTYLDLMLLSGEYITSPNDKDVAALLYVFFGGNEQMQGRKSHTNRFETEFRHFCENSLNIAFNSLKQSAIHIQKLIADARRATLVTTATLPRATIRKSSHSYRLKLQGHSRQLRALLPTN